MGGRSRMRVGAAGLAWAVVALGGCSPSADRVEDRLEEELQKLLGPADEYDVQIEGLSARSGEADVVTALGYRVQPEGAPTIDRMEVELHDIKYDRDRRRLERIGSSRVIAWITAADLAEFLELQDNISNATVTLGAPDSAFVEVQPSFGGFSLPNGVRAEVKGRFEGAGPELNFVVTDVNAAGFNMGEGAIRRITQMINPLVDLSDLPLQLEVTNIRVEGRSIRVEATGESASLPAG